MSLRAGDKFGPFQIIRFLGEGGFASVFAVKNDQGRDVALKVFNHEMDENDVLQSEFEKEFLRTKNLHHPNILAPFELGKINDVAYITMPLCDKSLMQELKLRLSNSRTPYYTERELVEVLQDVSDGLVYLQEKNIIHQDIKPDNILLDTAGSTRKHLICDFGIIAQVRRAILKQTVPFQYKMKGIAKSYAGPEVFKGKPEFNSDLFSLGVSIHELATGKVPFEDIGNTLGEVLNNGGEYEPIASGDYSNRFKRLIEALVSKNPKDRPRASEIVKWCEEYKTNGSWSDGMNDFFKQKIRKTTPIKEFKKGDSEIKKDVKKSNSKGNNRSDFDWFSYLPLILGSIALLFASVIFFPKCQGIKMEKGLEKEKPIKKNIANYVSSSFSNSEPCQTPSRTVDFYLSGETGIRQMHEIQIKNIIYGSNGDYQVITCEPENEKFTIISK